MTNATLLLQYSFTKSLCIYACEREGGKKKSIPFRRQRMEIDDMVPASDHVPVPVVSEDPYVADLLKVADENIAWLREEARVAREDTAGLEGKVSNLQHQVRTWFFGCCCQSLHEI